MCWNLRPSGRACIYSWVLRIFKTEGFNILGACSSKGKLNSSISATDFLPLRIIIFSVKKKMILRRAFYARPSTVVARELIGKVLVRKLDGKNPLKGVIVETEAYGGLRDPASHAYAGMTPRT